MVFVHMTYIYISYHIFIRIIHIYIFEYEDILLI